VLFRSAFLFLAFGGAFTSVATLPGFPSGDYNSFLTAMIVVQAVVFSGADAGVATLTDILSGYFDKLLLAPINRFSILFSSLLMAGTRALVQAVVIVIIALALGVSFKTGVAGILVLLLLSAVFGIAWSCLGLMIAFQTKSAQATQSSFVLFFPFIFFTSAFMPKEFLSGWFKVAVTANPVDYVLQGMRALIIVGWDWGTFLTGLWVLIALTVGLTATATWLYRRATA
jgi:ABC-2 type transport system permease protein